MAELAFNTVTVLHRVTLTTFSIRVIAGMLNCFARLKFKPAVTFQVVFTIHPPLVYNPHDIVDGYLCRPVIY